jgi:hypothetical protein
VTAVTAILEKVTIELVADCKCETKEGFLIDSIIIAMVSWLLQLLEGQWYMDEHL